MIFNTANSQPRSNADPTHHGDPATPTRARTSWFHSSASLGHSPGTKAGPAEPYHIQSNNHIHIHPQAKKLILILDFRDYYSHRRINPLLSLWSPRSRHLNYVCMHRNRGHRAESCPTLRTTTHPIPRPSSRRPDIAQFMQPNHALPAPAWGSLLIPSDLSWTYPGGGTTPNVPIGAPVW